jgi:hypothetical protein
MLLIPGWIILVVGLVLLWFLVQVAVGFMVSPITSGRAILRQKLKELGTDVSRVPEGAYTELVRSNLEHAKLLASLRRNENWRALFIQSLEKEAILVTELMAGAAQSAVSDQTRQTLVRYGVLG